MGLGLAYGTVVKNQDLVSGFDLGMPAEIERRGISRRLHQQSQLEMVETKAEGLGKRFCL